MRYQVYPKVRFGAVSRYCESYGAVRFSDISYGPVRFGPPLNRFFHVAVPIPVGETVQHTLFSTVHRIYIYKPYYTAVSYGLHRMYTPCSTAASYGSQAYIGALYT